MFALGNPVDRLGRIGKGFTNFARDIVDPGQWSVGGVVLMVAAVVIGGLTSNLLATMIAEEGWVGAFERNPKAWLYAVLVVSCAVTTTVVVLH